MPFSSTVTRLVHLLLDKTVDRRDRRAHVAWCSMYDKLPYEPAYEGPARLGSYHECEQIWRIES